MTDTNQLMAVATLNGDIGNPLPAPPSAVFPEFHFSTDYFSEQDRMAAWQDIFGRTIVNADFELIGDDAPDMAATIRSLPGLGTVTSEIRKSGDPAKRPPQLPRPALEPMVPELGAACLIRNDSEPLHLLRHYLAALQNPTVLGSRELQHIFVTHIHDLAAAALAATRAAAETTEGRGLQADRLRAIKDDILANLHCLDLTVTAVATRQRMTPRHVQRLFDMEGTTFSKFVREQRLARAHRMLANRRYSAHSITMIAYEAGFGDLSHFNHAFRRFYGMTPSDVRAAARRDSGS